MELTGDRRIAAGVLYSTIFHLMKRNPTAYVESGDINKLKKLAEQNALKYEQELTQGEREYILRLATKMGETMAEKARLVGQLQDHSGLGAGSLIRGVRKDPPPVAGETTDAVLPKAHAAADTESLWPPGLHPHGGAVRPDDGGTAGGTTEGAGTRDARRSGHEAYDPDRALHTCLTELYRLSEVQLKFVTKVIDRINAFNS